MLEACCYVYNVAYTGAADGWPLQLRNHYILPNHHHRALQDVTADNRRFTERRKKTVRFDHEDGSWPAGWDEERQGSQDSQTKDSGIDTSSTFTSSEDSNRGDVPKVGLTDGLLLLDNFQLLSHNIIYITYWQLHLSF